jgi:hypothetical protein
MEGAQQFMYFALPMAIVSETQSLHAIMLNILTLFSWSPEPPVLKSTPIHVSNWNCNA